MTQEFTKLLGPRPLSPREVEIIRHARKRRVPFLLYERCDGAARGNLCDEPLSRRAGMHLGRAADNEIVIRDARVGRVHAKLEVEAGVWYVRDLDSKNGTFVNDERITGPRRLEHRDVIRLSVAADGPRFWFDAVDASRSTASAVPWSPPRLTPREQELLAAVCVHVILGTGDQPATDEEMALVLNRDRRSIRRGLSPVYKKFGLRDVAQGRKRRMLFEKATKQGLVKRTDLPIDCADVAGRLRYSRERA